MGNDKFINADVNGSYNIMKKSNPQWISKGDRGFRSKPIGINHKEIKFYFILYSIAKTYTVHDFARYLNKEITRENNK